MNTATYSFKSQINTKIFPGFFVLFFSLGAWAQAPAKPATAPPPAKAQAPAAPAAKAAAVPAAPGAAIAAKPAASPEATAANLENLLEQYYRIYFGKNFVAGLVKNYRRKSNKMDPKFNYIDSPEFVAECEKAFKENWKNKARAKFNVAELQYIMVFMQSTIQKKISDLEGETVNPQTGDEIFAPVADKWKRK